MKAHRFQTRVTQLDKAFREILREEIRREWGSLQAADEALGLATPTSSTWTRGTVRLPFWGLLLYVVGSQGRIDPSLLFDRLFMEDELRHDDRRVLRQRQRALADSARAMLEQNRRMEELLQQIIGEPLEEGGGLGRTRRKRR